MAISLIACGIDPSKSILYQQSKVVGHAELNWILSCVTRNAWLDAMIQFKTKQQDGISPTTGLFTYPVLQTADILLYKATHVPVGDDQSQHIQLARKIAESFNRRYDVSYFSPPVAIMEEQTNRVMSLRDGKCKMSKSDVNESSRIDLTDDASTISKKIRAAKTDTLIGVNYDLENRPEISNLVTIYSSLSGQSIDSVCTAFANSPNSEFKAKLTSLLVEHICPIGAKIAQLTKDPEAIDLVLQEGAVKANAIAEQTMNEVKKIVGYL